MKPSHGHPDHIWDYAAMQNVQIYTWGLCGMPMIY